MARLIRVDPNAPPDRHYRDGIADAAAILRGGGLVGFPTETVYGLAADALDAQAVARVYAVKERPLDSALILHLADAADAGLYVSALPAGATALMDAYWPGPLTLVLHKARIVPDITTGGRDNVGLRVPDHSVARDLIRATGRPVVGPSANLSGRPSPLTADHVLAELGDRIEAVLDAGPTHLGIESTVVDLTSAEPTVLRLGAIPPEALRQVLGRDVLVARGGDERAIGVKPGAHGLRFRLVVVDGRPGPATAMAAVRMAQLARNGGQASAVLVQTELLAEETDVPVVSLGSQGDLIAAAARLYPALRECEDHGYQVVFAPAVPRTGLGLAIMHRLSKLASDVIQL